MPMVWTGFSEVIGSWNTMPMRLPRICCNCRSGKPIRSVPAMRTWPEVMRALALGSSPMMAMAVTLLPQPLSPTRLSVSPRATENDT